jgi:putative ABC transport system permease protein
MRIFVRIGWRNLWRNKRRSLVVISSIAIGIFAMILSMGVMNGMNNQMVENTIKTSLGHIAIHRKGFQDDMKLKYHFTPEAKIIEAIESDSRILAYAPRIKLQGMIRSSESSRGVMLVGIDPEKERTVSNIYDYTLKKEGSRFLTAGDDDVILISKSNADKLDLLVGDKLVVMFQDSDKEIIGVGLEIVGIFQTPIESFDKFVVFLNIKTLQRITGLNRNISELTAVLKNKRAVDRVKEKLIATINDKELEILSWKDMAPYLVSAVKLFDTIMYIFFMIVFITVIFSVANTLIMAIMERFHEIGVMKSIGTRPSWIFNMVLFEAINLGIVGLIAGIITGLVITGLLGVSGINLSFYAESMRMFGTGSIIYPAIKTLDIVVATIIVLITTIIAALYPAIKAARIKPLDALHFI